MLRVTRQFLFDVFGLRIQIHRRREVWLGETNRFAYQRRYVDFHVKPGDRVLDIGSGGSPFPYATVLADRFVEMSATRREPLVTHNKPFLVADVHHLPFGDKTFDYVYCAHLVEAIDDPAQACRELMRVGKRGFIETPAAAKDMLFAWARGVQKWHVVAIGKVLCFFEYSERELDGIRSTVWRDLVFSQRHNEFQQVFRENQDVFNVMFTWEECFSVIVFRLDGTIETMNFDAHTFARPLALSEACA